MAPFSSDPALSWDEFKLWNERYECRRKHPFIKDDGPSPEVVFYSIGILLLTIIIECLARATWDLDWWRRNIVSLSDRGRNPDTLPIQADVSEQEHSTIAPTSSPSTPKPLSTPAQARAPPPALRIRRFVHTTLFLAPLCVLFAYRIKALRYSEVCYRSGLVIPSPRWWAITLFNIVPLVCACTAWMRTIVDCVLVRWGRSVRAEQWPSAALVTLPLFACIRVLVLVMERVMGGAQRGGEGRRERDIETGAPGGRSEEEMRLMDAEGAVEEEDDEERTAYSPTRSSFEGKLRQI